MPTSTAKPPAGSERADRDQSGAGDEELYFRVSSGLKRIIGRDLITNEFVAIFELVKNSFDAGAGSQTTATATELSAGTYEVTVTDANQCSATTSVTVAEPSAINVQVETEPDTGERTGRATVLTSGGTAPYTYQYSGGVEGEEATVSGLEVGEYTVTVTDDNGCTATQAFRIDERGNCLVSRPVITPNGDGSNENFIIGCVQQYERATLLVFNRWGQEVFSMDNYDNSWTGQTNRGRDLPEGVYFYVLDYRDTGGTNQQLKGNVTLLRE